MFGPGTAAPAAGAPVVKKGLLDNYDDVEGYYNFQVRTSASHCPFCHCCHLCLNNRSGSGISPESYTQALQLCSVVALLVLLLLQKQYALCSASYAVDCLCGHPPTREGQHGLFLLIGDTPKRQLVLFRWVRSWTTGMRCLTLWARVSSAQSCGHETLPTRMPWASTQR